MERVAILVGVLILSVLTLADFVRNVPRPNAPQRYYVAMTIFMASNLALYLLLCRWLTGVDPFAIMRGDPGATLSAEKFLIPAAVGVMYFGAGSARIKFGDYDFNLYEKLVGVFIEHFRLRIVDPVLTDQIRDSEAERKSIARTIERLHKMGVPDSVKSLGAEWKDTQEDCENLDEIVRDLEGLQKTEQLAELQRGLRELVGKLNLKVRDKLRGYLVLLLERSVRAEKDLDAALKLLGIAPERVGSPLGGSALIRCAAIAVPFGFLQGALVSFYKEGAGVLYIWAGTLSLMIFSVVLALTSLGERGFNDVTKSIWYGALGGCAGIVSWTAVTDWKGLCAHPECLIEGAARGLIFGLATALALSGSSRLLQNVGSRATRYGLLALGGAATFTLAAALLRLAGLTPHPGAWVDTILRPLPLGATAALALGLGCNVFAERRSPTAERT